MVARLLGLVLSGRLVVCGFLGFHVVNHKCSLLVLSTSMATLTASLC